MKIDAIKNRLQDLNKEVQSVEWKYDLKEIREIIAYRYVRELDKYPLLKEQFINNATYRDRTIKSDLMKTQIHAALMLCKGTTDALIKQFSLKSIIDGNESLKMKIEQITNEEEIFNKKVYYPLLAKYEPYQSYIIYNLNDKKESVLNFLTVFKVQDHKPGQDLINSFKDEYGKIHNTIAEGLMNKAKSIHALHFEKIYAVSKDPRSPIIKFRETYFNELKESIEIVTNELIHSIDYNVEESLDEAAIDPRSSPSIKQEKRNLIIKGINGDTMTIGWNGKIKENGNKLSPKEFRFVKKLNDDGLHVRNNNLVFKDCMISKLRRFKLGDKKKDGIWNFLLTCTAGGKSIYRFAEVVKHF